MNFTSINEFAPNDLEELVVDNPRLMKAANRPQIGRKQKANVPSTGEDEGDQVQAPNSKSKGAKAKKAKTGQGSHNKLAIFESDDEDHQPQSLSVRAYFHLKTTSQQPGRSKKSNMVTIMKSTQCNPFIFMIDSSFKAFVREVASAAKTMMSNLMLSHLRWKFKTPASLPTKLLTDEVGFQAMLDAVQECTKGHTIFLYLPKPIDLEGPPELSSCRDTRYEYDEYSSVPPEHNAAMSHKAQINALHQESTKEVMELEHCYPIGSHPLFPNKRIYVKNGLFLELTSLRLDVWGAAISTQSDPRATYDMPPVSNYFMKDKAIKPACPPPNSPMTMFAAYGAYAKGEDYTPNTPSRSEPDPSFFTHQLPYPPLPPSYYHPPYYPYQYSYYPLPNAVHPTTAPPHPSSAPLVPAPATGSVTDLYPSPGITTKCSVTLEAFCAKFVVSASDSEKLSKLGYNPGNRIVESLTMGDWQSVGFTLLSWRTFLSHHRKFCDTIIAGTWLSP
ncbi:hypothetical protein DFJ58DRAFT_874432 [Suillus subalutaceus]|uniref:uncharacterized protein n=1 Tax=Suillus subalutaceus TaxID=48586 RepID=UPI001B884269|nr:uncharacterized protein DFJ58DRAFT_874432 [Suillus subalutaceus]KAG1860248.1 hypothetical protein DFJ58DRAFT_874432 [Suillus subalutaceus]